MTAENLRYCARRGSLVGTKEWLPTQPFDYDWGATYLTIGCNNIGCSKCGQAVTSTTAEDARHYRCRCDEAIVRKVKTLDAICRYPGFEGDEPPGWWSCAGHPAVVLPADLDGVYITQDRLGEVARVGFVSPPFIPANITERAFWVSRLYWLLPELLRPALAEVVAALVLDSDPRVAIKAMDFFSDRRTAPTANGLRRSHANMVRMCQRY